VHFPASRTAARRAFSSNFPITQCDAVYDAALAPSNARGQWPDRGITRPVRRQAYCAPRQPYERASGAAGGLARRVREMSDHLDDTGRGFGSDIEQDFVY